MTTKDEILALARENFGVTDRANIFGAHTGAIEAFYHAARNPLAEEVERLRSVIFAAETLDKAELGQQLAAANAEIERKMSAADFVLKQLAAAQAQIVGYREALELALEQLNRAAELSATDARRTKLMHAIFVSEQALSQPADTSALEAAVAKAGEVMRGRSAKAASDQWLLQGHAISAYSAIRALPGVTLGDLQG